MVAQLEARCPLSRLHLTCNEPTVVQWCTTVTENKEIRRILSSLFKFIFVCPLYFKFLHLLLQRSFIDASSFIFSPFAFFLPMSRKSYILRTFWKNFEGLDLSVDCKTIRHLLDQLEGLIRLSVNNPSSVFIRRQARPKSDRVTLW